MSVRGAYGFAVDGVGEAASLLNDIPAGAPPLRLTQELGGGDIPGNEIDETAASIPLLPDGWLELDRAAGSATYHVDTPLSVEALVHPYLAPAAAIASAWQGWESYHAGAFVVDGKAWAVTGERGAGKSTLVAALAARGHAVMADDLVVIHAGDVLPGPRTIDLRESAADRFGATRALGRTGMRDRWRLDLPPAPVRAPLAGWIYPVWADSLTLGELALSERLARPQANRAATFKAPPPEHALWLATLPGLEFGRPRSWDDLDGSLDALLDVLA